MIRVKDKLGPVTIYELIGVLSGVPQHTLSADFPTLLQRFMEARELYLQRQWTAAQDAFLSILDRRPEDGPSRMYCKRCPDYLLNAPPAGWDGVFTMCHK